MALLATATERAVVRVVLAVAGDACLLYTITLPLGFLAEPGARGVFLPQSMPDDFVNKTAMLLLLRPREFLANARDLVTLKQSGMRAYAVSYLTSLPGIRKDMTLLVRQLDARGEGIPLELYCFTRTTDWYEYEGIVSDIFDHMFAVLPEFGLRLYQKPAGGDLRDPIFSIL